ncbi:MAG: hypothetical protein UV58_C0005G0044 [Candidatus Wolfebacteria bacterium GW2011_GWC1_43_10]|nr:MAG: hypothetical protein UV58_C0005G0044 [Candidatus Wolfebacteria bacterium GW2011_GWC1_43_10]KKT23177.1 MAG: hypothetical protein UW08_C0001G0140 [Parcubacteria group bacterium GW2011_GWB1_43_8b]
MLGKLASGEMVVDRFNSHNHIGLSRFLPVALARINSLGRGFLVEEVDFGSSIGETICVPTGPGDEIVFAQRPKRFGLTRFVKNRKSEPCSSLVVILKVGDCGEYVLITAFVGTRPEPEPWDERNFAQQADPSAARKAAFRFWLSHALVWGAEPIVPGTETTVCPW